jgi:2-dehydropantoate 2-reductase
MRVCVVGAGAIGGLVGARLSAAGTEVSLLARGAQLSAIRRDGLRLIEPDGSELVAPDVIASDDLSDFGPQDTVVLALKAHQLAAVAPSLGAVLGADTTFVPMQNGVPWWFFHRFGGELEGSRLRTLDPDGVLERAIPPERLVPSIAYPAAVREGPGIIRLVEGNRFPVGELDGSRSPRAQGIADVLGAAGFKSRVLSDIRAHLWVKAWGNLAFNPISALTGATLGEICRDPRTRAVASAMMHEANDIAAALGIRTRLSVEQRIEGAASIGDHRTSMLQDVEAGRELEVGPLVGAFVELGQLTGTPTPTIEVVDALVSQLNARLVSG